MGSALWMNRPEAVLWNSLATSATGRCTPMTVSMRVMSAGKGYQYLLKSVVSGDGNRSLSTPLTRYYTEEGTPPGRWLGSGLHAVGSGTLKTNDPVTEQQLALLLGMGRDPVSGDPVPCQNVCVQPAIAANGVRGA